MPGANRRMTNLPTRQCTKPVFPATRPQKIMTLFLPVTYLKNQNQNDKRKENSTMNTMSTSAQNTGTQPVKVLYTAKTHTTGGREGGASHTSDGRLDVKYSLPGGPGTGTNPEQLF